MKVTRYACNFCGKTQDEVAHIVAGPGVDICSECVALCVETLAVKAGVEINAGAPRGSAEAAPPGP